VGPPWRRAGRTDFSPRSERGRGSSAPPPYPSRPAPPAHRAGRRLPSPPRGNGRGSSRGRCWPYTGVGRRVVEDPSGKTLGLRAARIPGAFSGSRVMVAGGRFVRPPSRSRSRTNVTFTPSPPRGRDGSRAPSPWRRAIMIAVFPAGPRPRPAMARRPHPAAPGYSGSRAGALWLRLSVRGTGRSRVPRFPRRARASGVYQGRHPPPSTRGKRSGPGPLMAAVLKPCTRDVPVTLTANRAGTPSAFMSSLDFHSVEHGRPGGFRNPDRPGPLGGRHKGPGSARVDVFVARGPLASLPDLRFLAELFRLKGDLRVQGPLGNRSSMSSRPRRR